jgi:hypothetical protein
MAKLLVTLAVGVGACGAGAAQNTPIHLVSAPKAITLGQTWTATLQTAKRAGRLASRKATSRAPPAPCVASRPTEPSRRFA